MIQLTSLRAYEDIRSTLGNRHKRVMHVLDSYDGRSMTNREIAQALEWPINTVTPRVNELVKAGLVREHCRRKCNVGSKMSIAWIVVPSWEIIQRSENKEAQGEFAL